MGPPDTPCATATEPCPSNPLRLREETIGCTEPVLHHHRPIPEADLHLAGALGEVTTNSILRERTLAGRNALTGQLQNAFDSRVLIEQAKGILAERQGVEPAQASNTLRAHARSTNRRLSDVAGDVVAGNLDPAL